MRAQLISGPLARPGPPRSVQVLQGPARFCKVRSAQARSVSSAAGGRVSRRAGKLLAVAFSGAVYVHKSSCLARKRKSESESEPEPRRVSALHPSLHWPIRRWTLVRWTHRASARQSARKAPPRHRHLGLTKAACVRACKGGVEEGGVWSVAKEARRGRPSPAVGYSP